MKDLLIKIIEVMESTEDTQAALREHQEAADRTDIPAYRKVCLDLAEQTQKLLDLDHRLLTVLLKQLKDQL